MSEPSFKKVLTALVTKLSLTSSPINPNLQNRGARGVAVGKTFGRGRMYKKGIGDLWETMKVKWVVDFRGDFWYNYYGIVSKNGAYQFNLGGTL